MDDGRRDVERVPRLGDVADAYDPREGRHSCQVSLIHASSFALCVGSRLETTAAVMEVAAWSRPVGRVRARRHPRERRAYFDARGPLRADWRVGDSV